MSELWTWMQANPWPAAIIIATALGTLLGRVDQHYGHDHPRLKRHLAFVIDLLTSWLPNLIPRRVVADPKPKREGGYTRILPLLILLALSLAALASCASWKAATRAGLLGIGRLAYTASVRAGDVCKTVVLPKCIEQKRAAGVAPGAPYKCAELQRCWTARRSVAAMRPPAH